MAYDIAVIGGGVAGLTAGLFAARFGHSTVVLVPLMPGGQLATINGIEDFPGFPQGVAGYDLGPMIQEQAVAAGAEFKMGEATALARAGDGWKITADEEIEARCVIVASGSRPRTLDVPGEDRLTGKGVSHCASCDGPMLKGKSVVVAGAGDSGLMEALVLAGFAAEIIVVEKGPAPTAQRTYVQRVLEQPKIKVRANTTIDEVLGENGVTGVRLRENGAVSELAVDSVFVYIGATPNTEFLKGVVELDSSGRVATDISMRTRERGLFAAGDVRMHASGQAVSAAGDGATAAVAAHRLLLQLV